MTDGSLSICSWAFYSHLPRPDAIILAQRRTGECRLKSSLHSTGAEDSYLCECGQRETVKHVMLGCKLWRMEIEELKDAVRDKGRWGDVPFLLGEWSGRKDLAGKFLDGEVSAWKSDLGAARAAIDFVRKKGRFKAEGQAG